MTDNKYQNGKIYTIRNKNNDTLIYIGSTVQPLHKRFYAHKINAYNEKSKEYNKLLFQKIRETNNINDWYIELYENFPCNNKEQLNKREGEIIREISTLNKNIAGRTLKESQKVYKEKNKEQIKEAIKEYREANKERIKEQKKEYYETNKEQINDKAKEYREANKERIKEYREANKERIKEQRRQRYKNKKETI